MLTFFGRNQRYCDGATRRDFLRVGALAVGGLTMADVLRSQALAGPEFEGQESKGRTDGRGKSVIMIFNCGAPSHIDLWDMKPDAPDNVRVNVVAPSATDVGLFARVAERTEDPAATMAMVARNTPMQRLGSSEEVAATVAFLCSPGAGFLSGAIIPLDGAMAARRIV